MNDISPQKIPQSSLLSPAEIIEMSIEWDEVAQAGTGIYFLIDSDEIVYVGKSVQINDRIRQHREDKRFSRYGYVECPHDQLEWLEAAYIRLIRPLINTMRPLVQKQLRPITCPAYYWQQGKLGSAGYARDFLHVGEVPMIRLNRKWAGRTWA